MNKSTRRKQLQTAQKKLKRNHQPKRTRRKNWVPDHYEELDDVDFDTHERVMPRGEQERRRSVEKVAFSTVTTDEDEVDLATDETFVQQGTVIEVSKGGCQVDTNSKVLLCHIRGTLKAQESGYTNVVAVGDEVLISEDDTGSGVIESVLPRRTMLVRPDSFRSHLQQVLVANADQLLIVSAWQQPALWLELIDRYLIAAQRNNLPAVICVNKIDLEQDADEVQTTLQPYRDLGYQVILTSALTGEGVDTLQALLYGKTTVLSGLSGVGKSSLLNAVQPGLALRVGSASVANKEGRHTTSQATLTRLNSTDTVIDTPGIREFGLSGLTPAELGNFYPEIAEAAPMCRFANCTHLVEPNCAVQTAVAEGRIATSRYENYRQIYETL